MEIPNTDPQMKLLSQFPCSVCGQTQFEFGQFGSPGGMLFSPGNGKFWNMPRSFWSPKMTIARACLNCGNLQGFIRKFTPLPEG